LAGPERIAADKINKKGKMKRLFQNPSRPLRKRTNAYELAFGIETPGWKPGDTAGWEACRYEVLNLALENLHS
jgi:hypothetical protein